MASSGICFVTERVVRSKDALRALTLALVSAGYDRHNNGGVAVFCREGEAGSKLIVTFKQSIGFFPSAPNSIKIMAFGSTNYSLVSLMGDVLGRFN